MHNDLKKQMNLHQQVLSRDKPVPQQGGCYPVLPGFSQIPALCSLGIMLSFAIFECALQQFVEMLIQKG